MLGNMRAKDMFCSKCGQNGTFCKEFTIDNGNLVCYYCMVKKERGENTYAE